MTRYLVHIQTNGEHTSRFSGDGYELALMPAAVTRIGLSSKEVIEIRVADSGRVLISVPPIFNVVEGE